MLLVLLSYYLSFQLFRYAFLITIFSSKDIRILWRPIVGMLRHAFPVVGRIFFSFFFFFFFGMSCFVCIVLPFVDISLIFIFSPDTSGWFPQVVLFFFLVLSFPFSSHIFQDLFVLPFWPAFVDVISVFPVEFPFLVLTVSSCLLRGSQFSHILISPQHRLVRLTLLYSLICTVVYNLSCSFLF